MHSRFRFSFVLVAGMFLGYYLALSLRMSDATPARPFEINMSQPIRLQPIVRDRRGDTELDQTAKNTSLSEENGVIITTHGGIGNQLFRYACSYALARDRKLPLYNLIPNSSSLSSRKFNLEEPAFTLDKFQVPLTNVINRSSNDKSAITYVSDFQLLFRTYPLDKTLLQIDGVCMGYYGYWTQYKKDIVAMFQLRPEVVQGFSRYVTNLGIDIENAEESVAVHIRKGDYHKSSWDLPISFQRDSILKISYMIAQRQKLRDSSGQRRPKFFIFSDDIEYSKKELNSLIKLHDLVFVSASETGNGTTSLEVFYLMMKCKHFIIPHSTFSWWAAFLGTHKENNGPSSNSYTIVIASAHRPSYLKKMYGGDTEKLNFYRKVIYGFSLFPNGWIVYTPAD